MVEPPRGGSFIWQIGVHSSSQDRRQVDQVFFMESSQLYAATLTHYSTEPLTTGPDYDPLLLLLALAGDLHPTQDRQGTPARSASKTSLAKLSATCVQDVRIGCIQDVLVFETLRIIVKPMDLYRLYGATTPRAHSPRPSPAHTPTMSDIQNYTQVRQDRAKAQEETYCFLFITQSALLASHCQQRRKMTPA